MASRDREKEFPATSLSRTTGSSSINRLQQAALLAPESQSHPLGFPPHPAHDAGTQSNHPKYRPYTPRNRAVPTATVTTGTTVVHPPSSPGHQYQYPPGGGGVTGSGGGSGTGVVGGGGGDATTKLQLTNAKAGAQGVGLDTASVGWAMMEKVVAESETGELWADIWSAITGGSSTRVSLGVVFVLRVFSFTECVLGYAAITH